MDMWGLHEASCPESFRSPPGGLIKFIDGTGDMSMHIVGIPKPLPNEPKADLNDGLVMDAQLLDRVFKLPITTVKSIPHNCRMAFS